VLIAGGIVVTAAAGYLMGTALSDAFGPEEGGLSEYQGATALHREIYARALEMSTANTALNTVFSNRLEDTRNIAWMKGKAAAIEQMNAGKPLADAEAAALEANDAYYTTIEKNVLNHWNESLNKIEHYADMAVSHSNLDGETLFGVGFTDYKPVEDTFYTSNGYKTGGFEEKELRDGTMYDTRVLFFQGVDTSSTTQYLVYSYDGRDHNNNIGNDLHNSSGYIDDPDTNAEASPELMAVRGLLADIWTQWDQMNTNLQTFVNDAYTSLQSGDIDLTDLVDPVTLASEYSSAYDSTGYYGYAAANLAILGVPTDLSGNATITLVNDGATVSGTLFVESPPTGGLDVGTEYDPVGDSLGTVYLAYAPESGNRELAASAYTDVDGGLWTLNSEPEKDVVYTVYTVDGETATAEKADFTDNGDGTYTVDLSSQLDNTIVGVSQVIISSVDGLPGELIQITQPFIIESLTDTKTGESVSAYEPEPYNQQTTDVTLTQAQLEALLAVREDFDESPAGGGGLSFDRLDFGGIPGEGVLLFVVGIIALLFGSR
jgi:hypothetical protein